MNESLSETDWDWVVWSRIQLDCHGMGSPTVVLEAGLGNLGSLSWSAVQDSIATTTRVCSYSRAGIMWSEQLTKQGKFLAVLVSAEVGAPFSDETGKAELAILGSSSVALPLILRKRSFCSGWDASTKTNPTTLDS